MFKLFHNTFFKEQKVNPGWAWWQGPELSPTWEAEVEGLLGPRSLMSA